MPFAVLVILYVLATAGVVGLAIFVSYLADLLQKKTKYSAALISGVLLGIMTGIPELVTGLTSVIGLHSPELAVGDVLGSNVFNIFTLGLFTLIFFKNFKKSQIQKSEFINIGSLILVYALYVAGFFTNGIVLLNGVFSIISLFVMVIYVINVWFMTKQTTNENFNRANKSRLTATQIILLFISCGLLLAGASIGLTYVAESIIHHVNMDKAFGASLFLGVTTSLPEIISVVGLFYMKNFNAGFSHLLGSNIFNCFVFAIIDAISPRNVFPTDNSYFQKCLVVGGLLISFLLAIALLVHNFHQKHTKNLLLDIALIAILGLIILTYVAYLVLAFLHHTDVISHSQFVQHHNSMLKYSM